MKTLVKDKAVCELGVSSLEKKNYGHSDLHGIDFWNDFKSDKNYKNSFNFLIN